MTEYEEYKQTGMCWAATSRNVLCCVRQTMVCSLYSVIQLITMTRMLSSWSVT